MTGRELIIYILENHLEDEEVLLDGRLVGYISVEEAAIKWGVGVQTVYAYILTEMVDYIRVGETCLVRDTGKPTKPVFTYKQI